VSTARLQVFRKAIAACITQPIISWLSRTSITPNTVTWIGFIIILAASALVATGHPFAAGWVVLLSGLFDILDGALARRTNKVTRFGGILDSTLDRLSEAVILTGIMAYFLFHSESPMVPYVALLIIITLTFSFLVSYIRSRAEAAGIDCQVGIFTRAERVIILALGLLLSFISLALVIALAVIAALSIISTIQRLLFAYQKTGK